MITEDWKFTERRPEKAITLHIFNDNITAFYAIRTGNKGTRERMIFPLQMSLNPLEYEMIHFLLQSYSENTCKVP